MDSHIRTVLERSPFSSSDSNDFDASYLRPKRFSGTSIWDFLEHMKQVRRYASAKGLASMLDGSKTVPAAPVPPPSLTENGITPPIPFYLRDPPVSHPTEEQRLQFQDEIDHYEMVMRYHLMRHEIYQEEYNRYWNLRTENERACAILAECFSNKDLDIVHDDVDASVKVSNLTAFYRSLSPGGGSIDSMGAKWQVALANLKPQNHSPQCVINFTRRLIMLSRHGMDIYDVDEGRKMLLDLIITKFRLANIKHRQFTNLQRDIESQARYAFLQSPTLSPLPAKFYTNGVLEFLYRLENCTNELEKDHLASKPKSKSRSKAPASASSKNNKMKKQTGDTTKLWCDFRKRVGRHNTEACQARMEKMKKGAAADSASSAPPIIASAQTASLSLKTMAKLSKLGLLPKVRAEPIV
ncbi:hypothetical protein HDU97_008659 [Phlyctochytrium planicorne]|nr:hypothetical protein HDU97_008659 [Phlyctochytrium planicorne]